MYVLCRNISHPFQTTRKVKSNTLTPVYSVETYTFELTIVKCMSPNTYYLHCFKTNWCSTLLFLMNIFIFQCAVQIIIYPMDRTSLPLHVLYVDLWIVNKQEITLKYLTITASSEMYYELNKTKEMFPLELRLSWLCELCVCGTISL